VPVEQLSLKFRGNPFLNLIRCFFCAYVVPSVFVVVESAFRNNAERKVREMKLLLQLQSVTLLVGLTVICAGCGDSKSHLDAETSLDLEAKNKLSDSDVPKNLIKLAETDQLKLIKKSLHAYDAKPVRDYTCKFYEHERIGGRMQQEQITKVKFLQDPFSVAMKWIKNPPVADAVVYVSGKYKNSKGVSQMVAHPTGGVASFFTGGSVLKTPDCREAMQHARRPITEFGFRKNLTAMVEGYKAGLKQKLIEQEYGGAALVGKQKCIVLIRILKDLPKYPPVKLATFFDVKTLLPVRFLGYGADGKLIFDYRYTDIKINTGLKPSDFTPEANGISNP
jgi:hypothetical protein